MTKKKSQPDVQLHEKFDLSDVSTEARLNHATHLEHLLMTPGWLLMKQILESNLNVLERAIILKRDPKTGTSLDEKGADELRLQHAQIEQLLKKPAELIAYFRQEKVVGTTGAYDPYQQNADWKEERKVTNAGTLTSTT